MVYSRSVGGRPRTFEVSGLLWRDTLVMKDRETGTLWSQVTGQAIHGPEAGGVLEPLAAVVTTWGEWKRVHPDTLVLQKEPLEGSPYEDYFTSEEALGISSGTSPDPRLPGKAVVLAVRLNGAYSAYPLAKHRGPHFLNDELGGEPILVVFGSEGGPPLVYSRRLGNGILEAIALDQRGGEGTRTTLRDSHGRHWDLLSGQALERPRTGERLRPIPAFTVYWFVWARFYPDTEVR